MLRGVEIHQELEALVKGDVLAPSSPAIARAYDEATALMGPAPEDVLVEHPLCVPLGLVLSRLQYFVGGVDLSWVDGAGVGHILDWKTKARVTGSGAFTLDRYQLAEDTQLLAYAYQVFGLSVDKVVVHHCYISTSTPDAFIVSSPELDTREVLDFWVDRVCPDILEMDKVISSDNPPGDASLVQLKRDEGACKAWNRPCFAKEECEMAINAKPAPAAPAAPPPAPAKPAPAAAPLFLVSGSVPWGLTEYLTEQLGRPPRVALLAQELEPAIAEVERQHGQCYQTISYGRGPGLVLEAFQRQMAEAGGLPEIMVVRGYDKATEEVTAWLRTQYKVVGA